MIKYKGKSWQRREGNAGRQVVEKIIERKEKTGSRDDTKEKT